MSPSSASRSTAPSSAPSSLAPSPLQAVCPWPGARRQSPWRRARRHSLWRRAKGPFLEFFPPGIYLRETFKKKGQKVKNSAPLRGRSMHAASIVPAPERHRSSDCGGLLRHERLMLKCHADRNWPFNMTTLWCMSSVLLCKWARKAVLILES